MLFRSEFDKKPLRAFSNKASALWFLEKRPNCELKILPKVKDVLDLTQFGECLF